MQALEAVMNEGFNVAGVVCVIDREDKTPNYLIQNNIKYSSLFKHSDFKSFIDEEIKKKQKLKTQSLFLWLTAFIISTFHHWFWICDEFYILVGESVYSSNYLA